MYFFFRWLFGLRYRVTLKGLESVQRKRSGGVLFLPNHVAYVDPALVIAWLAPHFPLRPVVVEFLCRVPILRFFLRKLRAFPIPDFDTSVNQYKTYKAKKELAVVAEALKRGDNVLFYPSGKLKRGALESLHGNAGLHRLLSQCPEATVVLVRIRGLWGSSFSRALQGASPDLWQSFWHGVKVCLQNGIFFAPRRAVEIEIQGEPEDFPWRAMRVELNQYLENWYNRGGAEPLTLVRNSFWSQKLPEVKQEINGAAVLEVSAETRSQLYAEIRKILERPELEISPEMRFADLGMDSLNLAELIVYLGQTYQLGPLYPDQFNTVQDALVLIEGKKQEERAPPASALTWPEEEGRPNCSFYPGKTFPEVFLNVCEKMGPFAACADDAAGVLTYAKVKQAVLVLAQAFRTWPEERVAVLLPASAGAYIVYFALLFAGKIPVMLNWTLGPRYLEEMMRISGARRALTSWRFLEKVSDVNFGSVVEQIELLEDIRSGLTLGQKIKGAWLARRSTQRVLRKMGLDRLDEHRAAIILFTSGTEAKPKGVPLSHRNILENERVSFKKISLNQREIFYGILPPFHSFGFSADGVVAWFIGGRIAYFPDPTDSYSIAAGIERWKITVLVLSPTFFKRILQVARPQQLRSIRFVIMGAEKVPNELYDLWTKTGVKGEIIEGYGATECSPVISLVSSGTFARLGSPPEGVGQLNEGFSLKTIHPETQEVLPEGAEGEICLTGPCVFKGYLGDVASPFIQIEGKPWYRTGDIGRMDAQRVIYLTDRLKRFAKIGGEMISLRAVEQTLFEELLKRGVIAADVANIAICADERALDKQQLILFTTVQLELDALNRILFEAGFSRLVKISVIQQIPEIPLMATGKINYRKLKETL